VNAPAGLLLPTILSKGICIDPSGGNPSGSFLAQHADDDPCLDGSTVWVGAHAVWLTYHSMVTFLQWTGNARTSRLAEAFPNPGEASQRRRTYPESSLDDEGAGAIRNFLSSENRITFFTEAQI
jgi:hypothetical protein